MSFIWMDLEMTGLNVEEDEILEIALIITDDQLVPKPEQLHFIIHHSKERLQIMNDWCIEHHGKSGLTQKVLESKTTLEEAENQCIQLVSKYFEKGSGILAGNSVYMDKRFIEKYLPKLASYLHYRIIDVSTIKELCYRWYPNEFIQQPQKQTKHRALDDILESIQELKYYQSNIFKQQQPK